MPDVGQNDQSSVGQSPSKLRGDVRRIDQIEFAHEYQAGHPDPLDPGPGIMLGRSASLPGKGLWILRPGVLLGKSNQTFYLILVVIQRRHPAREAWPG